MNSTKNPAPATCPEAHSGQHLWLANAAGDETCTHCLAERTAAEKALLKSDRAILRQLAYAAMNVKTATDIIANTDPADFAAFRNAGEHLTREAGALDTIRRIVGLTGAAERNPELAGEAMAGIDDNL